MKQFRTVFNFELKNYFKNKIFIGTTVFLVLAIAIVMFIPKISNAFSSIGDSSVEKSSVMLIASTSSEDAQLLQKTFAEAFPNYDVCQVENDIEKIKSKIISEEAECALIITGPTSYKYYVKNLSITDVNTDIVDEVLQNNYRVNSMIQNGISSDQASQIISTQIDHDIESFDKDQSQNFIYTYIIVVMLFMVIMIYGQMVASTVAIEKSSRTMELLITSVRPTAMMFGKIIASCVAGFFQLMCVFGSSILLFNINKQDWADNPLICSIFDMPIKLLLYMLLFFVLGFFIYAFLYGAIGSTVSRIEDINTVTMPITLISIFAFYSVIFAISTGNTNGLLIKVCSYIPFTSPTAMFTRIAMNTVPWYEISISIFILIISVFGIGILSAKIYKVGVFLYGTTPKIGSVLKSIKGA